MVTKAFDAIFVPAMTLEAIAGAFVKCSDGLFLCLCGCCVIAVRRDKPTPASLIVEAAGPFSAGWVNFRLIAKHPIF